MVVVVVVVAAHVVDRKSLGYRRKKRLLLGYDLVKYAAFHGLHRTYLVVST